MPDFNTILNLLTLILVGLGVHVVRLLRAGTEAAVTTTAEELAKANIRQLEWQAELTRVLQQTRGVERQELRFKSYGALWKELRPLAIYDPAPLNKTTVGRLAVSLSNWYFSECGGLFLTTQARGFYFALQDLLRAISNLPFGWDTDRSKESEGNQQQLVREVLAAKNAKGSLGVLDYFSARVFSDWQEKGAGLAEQWREGIGVAAASWDKLNEVQRFAVLQQAGSILRSSLSIDLESRAR